MPRHPKEKPLQEWTTHQKPARQGNLRIIGGQFRGRQIAYSGDPRTRPMKDATREAVFNLVGGWMSGKHVIDLFAGTGAVGLEAISRGAQKATLVERHFPTAKVVQENIALLGVGDRVDAVTSDTFFWARQFAREPNLRPEIPWAVFCCPPYALYVDQEDEVRQMLLQLVEFAPQESLFVVEGDRRMNPDILPEQDSWKLRRYPPAIIAVRRMAPTVDPHEEP